MNIFMDKKNKANKVSLINIDTIISRNLDIDDTEIDGDKVMMNLDKGQYFMMNEVGSRIWDMVEESMSVKVIIDTLCGEYEVDENTCKDSVVEFLGVLSNADLISVS